MMAGDLSVAVVVAGALLVAAAVVAVVSFNRFAAQRAGIASSWAGIEVQLQRRHDLVPALVASVRGHAAHERAVFEHVAMARGRAIEVDRTDAPRPDEVARAEGQLSQAMRSLLAVAESYPTLTAGASFRDLQAQLVETEDRIAAARRLYNLEVRSLNRRVEAVPSNLVASLFGVEQATYFELTQLAAANVPDVGLA